jgi:hypothetical protein
VLVDVLSALLKAKYMSPSSSQIAQDLTVSLIDSKLNVKADRMRKNPKEPQGEIETNGCRFVCSRKLAEKPVNVLVSREKLKEIADYNEIFKIE